MSSTLRSERLDDGVVVVWLDHPGRGIVVLDDRLLDQLTLFLDDLEAGPPVTGLVIMSNDERVFAAGADLAEIQQLPDDALHAYLTEGTAVFERIATAPYATVAAIGGAALGGGFELALHCDAMIASESQSNGHAFRIGLPEASLGLCPGWGGTQMLPSRIDPAQAIAALATGQTWPVTEAPEGLFARVISHQHDLFEAAVAWILGNPKTTPNQRPRCIADDVETVSAALRVVRDTLHDSPAAHAVIEAIEVGLADGWAAGLAAEQRLLVSLRHTDEARSRIDRFLAGKS